MTLNKLTSTCIAPINMAVVKYWGKRDSALILPTNSSLSVTLDTLDLHTKTTTIASPEFNEDMIYLNGKIDKISVRIKNCIEELRKWKKEVDSSDIHMWKIHIYSINNFPTVLT